MKLLGAAQLLSGALAQFPFDIPTSIESSLGDFFEAANQQGVFGDVDFTQVMNHGCHCKRLTDYSSGGGNAVDDLDQACKVFFNKRDCLKRAGASGACNGVDYQGETYTAQLKFKNPSDPSAGVEFGADGAFHCALENDPCKKAICLVDHQAIYNLIELEHGHADHAFLAPSDCQKSTGVPQEKICVGHLRP